MATRHGYEFHDAAHRDWRGKLMLDVARQRAVHVETGAEGGFSRDGLTLAVAWDDYPADEFRFQDGVYCDARAPLHLLAARPGSITIPNAPYASVTIDGTDLPITGVVARVPSTNGSHAVRLRLGTSDAHVYRQVFGDREYDAPALPATAEVIFDLGANIGLAAVYFADRYPGAKIISVEPDSGNFALLCENTASIPGVKAEHAAVWPTSGTITFTTTSERGENLGAWGGQTIEAASPGSGSVAVPAISIPDLMARYSVERINVLKVDIEGAELELFSRNTAWLSVVDMVLVETHDRFKPGTEAAAREAMREAFEELPQAGENLVFRRRGLPDAPTASEKDGLRRTLQPFELPDLPIYIMHYTPLAGRRAMMDQQIKDFGFRSAEYITDHDREALGPNDLNCFYRNDPARHAEMTAAIGNRFLETIGWHPDKETWHEGVDYSRPHVTPYTPLSGSEISLCCKHAMALGKAAKSSHDIILMLEDDAIFCADFADRLLANLEGTPKDWDIIFPGSALGIKAPGRRDGKTAYLMEPPHVRCSDSYLITRAAAAQLHKALVPFTLPYDFELMYWLNRLSLKTYWWEPSLVTQGSESGAFPSALR